MPIQIKRKEGESSSAFLYRFSKKVQQSGILKEAKKRRRRGRNISRTKRKVKAIYRDIKRKEVEKMKKMGKI